MKRLPIIVLPEAEWLRLRQCLHHPVRLSVRTTTITETGDLHVRVIPTAAQAHTVNLRGQANPAIGTTLHPHKQTRRIGAEPAGLTADEAAVTAVAILTPEAAHQPVPARAAGRGIKLLRALTNTLPSYS